MVAEEVQGFGGGEVENGDLGGGGREEGGSRGHGQDGFDGGGVLECHDCARRCAGIPYADGRVVGARDEHAAQHAWHEGCGAHVVTVADELRRALAAGQIPQAHRLVVGGRHQCREFRRGELGDPDGLLVILPGLEDGARVDVEDLDLAAVVAGDHDAAIAADLARVRDVAEARDGLEELASADRVDLDAGAGRDGEGVGGRGLQWIGGRRGEGDVGDGVGSRGRDQLLRFEGFPVSLLWCYGRGSAGQLHLLQLRDRCRHCCKLEGGNPSLGVVVGAKVGDSEGLLKNIWDIIENGTFYAGPGLVSSWLVNRQFFPIVNLLFHTGVSRGSPKENQNIVSRENLMFVRMWSSANASLSRVASRRICQSPNRQSRNHRPDQPSHLSPEFPKH